ESHMDLPGVSGMNASSFTPSAVGNFYDPFSQNRLGVVQHLLTYSAHQLGAKLLVQCLHSRFRDIVRRDFAFEIETDHDRLPRHIDESVKEIFSQFSSLHQLDSGNADTFVTDLSGARGVAAGRHRADVHHMHEGRAPAHELALQMNGRDQVNIRLMDRGYIGIIEQKDIIGMDATVVFKLFDDSLNGKTRAGDVPTHGIAGGQNIALGQVQIRHGVMHLLGVYDGTD